MGWIVRRLGEAAVQGVGFGVLRVGLGVLGFEVAVQGNSSVGGGEVLG